MSSTVLHHGEGNPRNSEGSFVELAGGKILFAYSKYSGTGWRDHCAADIWGVTSEDGGESWGNARLIEKNTGLNLMSVSLLRLRSGRIAMVTLHKNAIPNWHEFVSCHPFIRFSDDEAQTWSEPVDIAGIPPTYIIVHNDRLVQLSSGRLLLPSSYSIRAPHDGYLPGIGIVYISDDEGQTWRPSRQCCYPPPQLSSGLVESGVVELKDGRVLCWFRTGGGCQYVSYSHDGGDSWSIPMPEPQFRCPGSPLSMKRDPESCDLIAVWNDYNPLHSVKFEEGIMGRTPFVMARSSDDGKLWDRHQILENASDHGYAYTAMLFSKGKLLLGYCCGGKPECECMLQDLKLRTIEL